MTDNRKIRPEIKFLYVRRAYFKLYLIIKLKIRVL